MRLLRPILCGAIFFQSVDLVSAADHLSGDELKAYQLLKKFPPEERQAVMRKFAIKKTPEAPHVAQAAPPENSQTAVPSASPQPSKDGINKFLAQTVPGTTFLLRQDWKDIDIASDPIATAKATGAQISISDDRVKDNVAWTTHGTAALLYNNKQQDFYTTLGGYVTIDKLTNSATAQLKNNIDTLAYGGLLEFGTATEGINPYIANYFQLRAGGVEDHIKHTTAADVTLEWLPAFVDGPIHLHVPFKPIPGWPLIIRFDPEVLVQYAGAMEPGQLLAFNNRQNALRIGPEAALNIYPGTDPVLSHFHASVSYHWAYETFSGDGLDLLQTNLVYNLDDAGNIGLAGTYGRGRDENTGTYEDIFTVSLTGKI